ARKGTRLSVTRRVSQVAADLRLGDGEDVRCPMSDVLVVPPGDGAGFSGDAWASVRSQLDGPLIQDDDGLSLICRQLQQVQDVLHPRDVLPVQLGDAPHFFPATA